MEARNSSMMDLMRLKALREARLAARATAERERLAAEAAERAEAARQRELTAARLSEARRQLEQELAERRSRTTFERIADLRGELDAFERERELVRLETEARIQALTRRTAHGDRRGLYALVAACALSIGLFALADGRADAVATLSAPELEQLHALDVPAQLPLDALPASVQDEAVNGAAPLPSDAATEEAAPVLDEHAAPDPAPKPTAVAAPAAPARRATRVSAKRPATRAVAPSRDADADLLSDLDDCGDDPICGL